MRNPFVTKKETKEEAFWRWFSDNSPRYFEFEKDQEALFDELHDQLAKANSGTAFAFEFGPIEDNARDFIISADGIREMFPAVERLVAAAPELPQWRVIAFRPRREVEFEIQMDDVKISHEDVWFHLGSQGDKIAIRLFLSGIEDVNSEAAGYISYLMLDTALGEYDVETKVGYIEREKAPANPEQQRLKPLRVLAEEFDALYSTINDY
jgi:hypothetical protein